MCKSSPAYASLMKHISLGDLEQLIGKAGVSHCIPCRSAGRGPWLLGAQEGRGHQQALHACTDGHLFYFLLYHPQESYDQHLLVCHNLDAISSALSLLAEGSVISSGEGTCRGEDLGCHSESSGSSSSLDSSGHEDGSPRASRLALQLCMVLATSAAGRKVGNIVWDPC